MGTEIIVAATGIVNLLLGFFVSYFFQAMQRSWTLDNQRREWQRREWEGWLNRHNKFSKVIYKIYIEDKFSPVYNNELTESFSDLLSSASPPITLSREHSILQNRFLEIMYLLLEKLHQQEERENYVELLNQTVAINRELQEYIDKLIAETYGPPPSPLQRFTNWVQSKWKRASQARP